MLEMLLDTHCHLDAPEFKEDIKSVIARAANRGVRGILIPAVQVSDFEQVVALVDTYAAEIPLICFTLGIHPLFTPQASEQDIETFKLALKKWENHPRFVGVGEIGLDYFVTHLENERQEWFFEQQLQIASEYQYPVVLHVRKSHDQLLKRLRKFRVPGGVAHAFNGSLVQARNFLELNFKLGFGGTMTYARSLQIHRLVKAFEMNAYVLETDSPDIPPSWLQDPKLQLRGRNEPLELPKIMEVFAGLREMALSDAALQLTENAFHVFPKWKALAQQLSH